MSSHAYESIESLDYQRGKDILTFLIRTSTGRSYSSIDSTGTIHTRMLREKESLIDMGDLIYTESIDGEIYSGGLLLTGARMTI